MENKKYLPVKIIHLLLMVAAIVLCCVSLTKISADTKIFSDTGLRIVTYITEIIALISGIFYLAFGYKKNAAVFYKIFMWILVLGQAIICYRQIVGSLPILPGAAIPNVISLIVLVILAIGKDLGKAKSYSVAAILLVCRLVALILDITTFGAMPDTGFSVLSHAASNVLLAGTVLFMVTGKYLDKTARDAK